ncbi:MAG: Ldh family oxidoreductase [Alphaproteobacteria bacterium]|nr:Ldh family oxidoreductase [Alphaproteobacteria bacterium]
MPSVPADRLRTIARRLLEGAGAPADEAATVARHCVEANLAGHDSHGVIQIPTYIDRIDKDHIVPGAPIEVIQESPTTTVIDGHWGFGYVVTEHAMRTTIAKAETANIAAATVFRQGHIGRLAAYPLMAVAHDMIGLITADSGRSAKAVAPFGGREARLGTNPISIAVPSELESPLFIDMATSAVAAGKVNLALARGLPVPEGWIVDADGQPATDPARLKAGGALLPLGGSEGYKGFGLSTIVEIFSGLLTGLGFGVEPSGRHNDGCFMLAVKVEAFRPLPEFKREVAALAAYLKATPPADGFEEVMYPGEIESRRATTNADMGIAVEDSTWAALANLAGRFKMAEELGLP